MDKKKITISGTGCALADFLYTKIDFNSTGFQKYLSKESGDGGLCPGKLVFTEELERFSHKPYSEVLSEIAGYNPSKTYNIGGPALVSLIHASQLLKKNDYEIRFYGGLGKDAIAGKILDIAKQTPLNITNFKKISERTSPFTDVLSDSSYNYGQGERTFVNNIGAAWDYSPDELNNEFFEADIVCFGGTALVPQIHDNLTSLLLQAKQHGCITVVNTVFDFRNEKSYPDRPWPLGNTEESFKLIDVLLMDCEEALKISGQKDIEEAADYFAAKKIASFVITHGANEIIAFSNGTVFQKCDIVKVPVSMKITNILTEHPELKGDTTGCGDNFAGGFIASLAWQLQSKSVEHFDFKESLSWAIASGGFACFYVGGTYVEKSEGEKYSKIKEFQEDSFTQIDL
jgi:sugar/nucleoside kinase (ribokinase family)